MKIKNVAYQNICYIIWLQTDFFFSHEKTFSFEDCVKAVCINVLSMVYSVGVFMYNSFFM